MKRNFLMAMLMAFAAPAFAADHTVGVDLSTQKGGLAVGVDYTYQLEKAYGVGGYFHIYQKSTDNSHLANGMFMFGASLPVHVDVDQFRAYMAPGLGFVNISPYDANKSSAFTIGPRLAIGLLYQINQQVSVGIENVRYYSWFHADYNGQLIDDLALRAQVNF